MNIFNPFKPKSRAELIEAKAKSIVDDIFITKFTYEEIALIVNAIKPEALHRIQERENEFNKQLSEITNAKNILL